MNFQQKYADEINNLKKNENNIEFFRKLAGCREEKTKETIDYLLEFSERNNLKTVKAWSYYCLGWYHFNKSRYHKAIDCFLLSNDLFERLNNKDGLTFACNGLTNAYCQIGQFKLANEWGLKGISLCEESGNNSALATLLINTGINYIQMKYFSKGREIFHSLELMGNELSKSQQISCNLALAEIEINIGEPGLAFSYIANSEKIENELQIDTDLSEIHKLMGMAYIKLNLYDIAEEEFKKSLELAKNNDLVFEGCSTMVELSKLYFLVGRKHEAVDLLNNVINTCCDSELNILLRESYHLLYVIYKTLNKLDYALKSLEEYILIDNYMYDYEQNHIMAKMNVKHTKREADQYKSLYDKTELLSTIGQKILSNLNIKSIINIIEEEINKLLEADYFGIAVYNKDKDEATYYFVGENLRLEEVIDFKDTEKNAFGSYCIKNKKDIIIGNSNKEYKKYVNQLPDEFEDAQNRDKSYMNSLIYTPLIISDKVVGLMTVQSHKENAYNQNDLHTLKILANFSAIAIENAISYKKVEDLATYDNLTRFLTKFEIMRLGEIIYDKYKLNNSKFSVTMIDIDNFKTVNDTHGHVVGDTALSMVAETISSCIRNTDYIGRYGGDEFLLICPGLGRPEAVDVAERIRSTVENKTYDLGDGIEVKVTISLGVHEYSEENQTFTDVVRAADKNLYCAKGNDRNIVICS